jgi:hypothetical protein
MPKEAKMLTIYRRHVKGCEHRHEGRKYRRCRCPIWVDGFLHGVEIREALDLRDWEKAQQRIREWEAAGTSTVEAEEPTIEHACRAFENDARARELREPTLKKYRVLFRQLQAFAHVEGLRFIKECELGMLRKFRESWNDCGISALKKLERLRALMRFAHESGWITSDPMRRLKNPKVANAPTMPYTQDEMIRILAACAELPDNYGKVGGENGRRARALVLLLRYSGMRIGDTVTCAVDRLRGDRLFLYTQKTGVPVNVKLPRFVVDALGTISKVSNQYFFWTGEGKTDTAAGNWRRTLRTLFRLAGIKDGILTASGTPSQSNCSCPACHWSGFPCSWGTPASESRRSITRHGYARGKSNWKPIWSGAGHAIPWCSPRRRVRQRYTRKGRSSTD